jgi:hypothetical protein
MEAADRASPRRFAGLAGSNRDRMRAWTLIWPSGAWVTGRASGALRDTALIARSGLVTHERDAGVDR